MTIHDAKRVVWCVERAGHDECLAMILTALELVFPHIDWQDTEGQVPPGTWDAYQARQTPPEESGPSAPSS